MSWDAYTTSRDDTYAYSRATLRARSAVEAAQARDGWQPYTPTDDRDGNAHDVRRHGVVTLIGDISYSGAEVMTDPHAQKEADDPRRSAT
jgi:hypothetical protein